MAIGSSIAGNIPSAGTTTLTLTKIRDGVYKYDATVGSNSVPFVVKLRPSDPLKLKRTFGATLTFRPSDFDGPSSQTAGNIQVNFSVEANVGTAMAESTISDNVLQFIGALLQSGLLSALIDGSLE